MNPYRLPPGHSLPPASSRAPGRARSIVVAVVYLAIAAVIRVTLPVFGRDVDRFYPICAAIIAGVLVADRMLRPIYTTWRNARIERAAERAIAAFDRKK